MRSIFSQLGAFVHHLRPGPSPIRRAPRRYLRLESLESRIALATDTFINLAGGFWDTDRNWSLGHPPASGDDAIIPALQPGASVLLLFSSTTNSLSLAGNLDIAGPLTIAGTVSGGGTITLQNGLTTTGSLSQAHVASDITLVVRGGILDGLTLDGNVLIANFQPVEVRNGLTVNGTVTLGDQVFPATPKFTGTQTIDGTGTILFSNRATDQLTVDSNGTLTIGSGVTLRGYDVSIYSGSSGYGNVVLEGSIYVDNIQPGALFGPLLRINANTTITSSGELRLGDGAVNAVIIPQLQNSGNITFGVGSQLGVQGTASTSFSQTSTGSMSINIGSLPMHIQPPLLHVYRQASLAGTLTATYVNGFVPPLGTSYLVVESITLTGTFTNVVGGTAVYQGGNVFLNAMPPVATQLVVTSQPPASVGTKEPRVNKCSKGAIVM